MKALQVAALSKVDVRLMLPEKSDSPILQLASHSYLTSMLKAGIKIYFYHQYKNKNASLINYKTYIILIMLYIYIIIIL